MAEIIGDYIIRTIKLENGCSGFIMMDENGCMNIYINEKMSDHKKMLSIIHEFNHKKDFGNGKSISEAK